MPITDGVHPPLGHTDTTVDHPDAELIVRGLGDGLAINDAEGHYLCVSPAYESLSGYGASDLLGRTPFELDLIHPDDLEHVIEVQTEALTTRQTGVLTRRPTERGACRSGPGEHPFTCRPC